IFGFDIKAQFELPWLTRLLDNLPLLNTNALSSIKLSGAFAQLRPGITQTKAEKRAIGKGTLYPDEKRGVSFIADFEHADIAISFMHPSQWHLASAPAALPGYPGDDLYFRPNPPQTPN